MKFPSIYLPIGANRRVGRVGPDFEVVEDQRDLLVVGGQEEVGAVGVARIVGGVAGRVKLAPLFRRAAVRERAAAVRGGRARNSILYKCVHDFI